MTARGAHDSKPPVLWERSLYPAGMNIKKKYLRSFRKDGMNGRQQFQISDGYIIFNGQSFIRKT